ncbi:MAG: YciI family protein [Nostocoides sp.]
MSRYLILIPADEAVWDRKSDAEKDKVYAAHDRFHEALDKGGHTVLNTAPLTASSEAKVVRAGADGAPVVTEGPYAEIAEQLTGYYVIETDDEPGLLVACGELAFDERVVEVRPTQAVGV